MRRMDCYQWTLRNAQSNGESCRLKWVPRMKWAGLGIAPRWRGQSMLPCLRVPFAHGLEWALEAFPAESTLLRVGCPSCCHAAACRIKLREGRRLPHSGHLWKGVRVGLTCPPCRGVPKSWRAPHSTGPSDATAAGFKCPDY